MRELIADLYQEGITPADAEAMRTRWPPSAIWPRRPDPCIDTGSPNRRTGAEAGLAAAALGAPDRVCATLAQVLDNRTALFNWQTQESALRLLGQLGCRNQSCQSRHSVVYSVAAWLPIGQRSTRMTCRRSTMSSCAGSWMNSGGPRRGSRRRPRRPLSDRAGVALGGLLILQLPGIAAAALIECPPISATPGSKVVVDEVRPAAGGAAALSAFEERRLQNAIHQQIGQLTAERPAEVQAVICRQRWPEGRTRSVRR